jgi:hypothetical protein
MASGVLALEGVVLMLVTMPMIAVYGVRPGVALPVGLGLGVAAILVCGLLGSKAGVVAGSALQVAAIGLGLVVPVMFVLGAMFAGLWVTALVLGRKVDEAKAAGSA